MLLGTAAYMAPEQARGRAIDKRAEIRAFGCVLFELLAGRRAFEGDSITDTLSAILRDPPQWAALPPVPDTVRRLLEHCLEKDPKRRLRDIGDARVLLEDNAAIVSEPRTHTAVHPAARIVPAEVAKEHPVNWRAGESRAKRRS